MSPLKTIEQAIEDHEHRIRVGEDDRLELRSEIKGVVLTFRVFAFIVVLANALFLASNYVSR